MQNYNELKRKITSEPKRWLITGVAGFIGSNLLEVLLKLNQNVVGLDNLSTGSINNLNEVNSLVSDSQWKNFKFVNGDIRNYDNCEIACEDINYVLHQAALGSVPRSLKDPISTNENNIDGFLNILMAAKREGVDSFTYASSSSVYGDNDKLPKLEKNIGKPLSPYALTKYVNELYASNFERVFGFSSTGLRYFNIFGPRQDPMGSYAAVIPKWVTCMINNKEVVINGDGKTSRDFCFIENAVQANILAATSNSDKKNKIFNIAVSQRTSLLDLFGIIKSSLFSLGIDYRKKPLFDSFREGDVRHSHADISNAVSQLGYNPSDDIKSGISKSMSWYINNFCD